jgi:cellobiose-specific phosphotransferase system component IIC
MGVEERSPNSIYSAATDRSECYPAAAAAAAAAVHTRYRITASLLFSSFHIESMAFCFFIAYQKIKQMNTSRHARAQHTAHSTAQHSTYTQNQINKKEKRGYKYSSPGAICWQESVTLSIASAI